MTFFSVEFLSCFGKDTLKQLLRDAKHVHGSSGARHLNDSIPPTKILGTSARCRNRERFQNHPDQWRAQGLEFTVIRCLDWTIRLVWLTKRIKLIAKLFSG